VGYLKMHIRTERW